MQRKENQRVHFFTFRGCLIFFIIIVIISGLVDRVSFGQITQEDVIKSVHVKLDSKVLNGSRPLLISCPTSNKGKFYTVVYLLDAKTNNKLLLGIIDYLSTCEIIPEMILVGIENTERTRDMTPSKSTMLTNSGGAGKFHEFIKKVLIPYIEKNYLSSSEKILVGHSLGGLFSLFSLLKSPETFDCYIAISPSIQFNDFKYPPLIKNFFENKKGPKGFLFMSFSDEGDGGAFRRLNALYQDILPYAGDDFKVYCRQYPDNNHITTLIPAVSDALIVYFKNKSH